MSGKAVVVIPCRDEATTIGRVVTEARRHFSDVIVVDDGSTDRTAPIANSTGGRVIKHPRPLGYGAAIATGIKEARGVAAETVLLLDGDGAHCPEDGANLVRIHYSACADLTIGSRFLAPLDGSIPSPKVAANSFATLLFNRVTSSSFSDAASGLRVIDHQLFNVAIGSGKDFSAAYAMIASARKLNSHIVERPVGVRYDAREIFGTATLELKQFLTFCCSMSSPKTAGSLKRLLSIIGQEPIIEVYLADRLYVLHGLHQQTVYVFQQQHSWFIGETASSARVNL